MSLSGDYGVPLPANVQKLKKDKDKNDFFDLSILELFNINIEPRGVRNIVLHNNIVPLSSDYYFILNLNYNETEHKRVKVYCNNVYFVGDDIIWRKLIEKIKK